MRIQMGNSELFVIMMVVMVMIMMVMMVVIYSTQLPNVCAEQLLTARDAK